MNLRAPSGARGTKGENREKTEQCRGGRASLGSKARWPLQLLAGGFWGRPCHELRDNTRRALSLSWPSPARAPQGRADLPPLSGGGCSGSAVPRRRRGAAEASPLRAVRGNRRTAYTDRAGAAEKPSPPIAESNLHLSKATQPH